MITVDKHSKYKPGDIAEWKDGLHRKRSDGKWEKWNPESKNDKKEANLVFKKPRSITECKRFKSALEKAKSTVSKDSAWRVDAGHNSIDYLNDRIYTNSKGSTVAVTQDGDIISVCRAKDDSIKGWRLLQEAVKNGGKKLDSYDGNWNFYVNNGFEPISYVEFDENYAPNDWEKGTHDKEKIVFFKYVGKGNVKNTDKEDFYKKVKPASSYDEAMKKRDSEV
jgi:hypothetical protein